MATREFPPSLNSVPVAPGPGAVTLIPVEHNPFADEVTPPAEAKRRRGRRRGAGRRCPPVNASEACVEKAIAETQALAKQQLFDAGGKPKPYQDFLVIFTFSTILKQVPHDSTESHVVRWKDLWFVYNPQVAQVFLEAANEGDHDCAHCLCIAAAVILEATQSIPNSRLRAYAIEMLYRGGAPKMKKKRGRSAADNALRNMIIVGCLIPPLQRAGFSATRNEATTKRDSACSIVCKALKSVGIHLSEKAIERVWGKTSHLYDATSTPLS
jgi:hypothetical protein